ncbi:MAG: hypothetical protein ABI910_15725 [Gemmatimonadota bacterium]
MTSMLLHLALSAALATGTPGVTVAAVSLADSTRVVQAKASVEVDNQNFYDANVFVVQGLRSVRLGTVTGLTKETFDLPRDMVGGASIRFAIRPLASRQSSLTQEIAVFAGDTIGVVIPPF